MGYKTKEEQSAYQKKHYQANKGKYAKSQRQSRMRTKAILNELKAGGCTKCGFNEHPNCLDFHHLDPNEKEVNVATTAMKNKWGRERIMKEVDKCIVVCANCHRLIHA